jgi:serine/threonine protein kinase
MRRPIGFVLEGHKWLNLLFYRKCLHKKSGNEYAVKIVSRRQDCSREIQLLKMCQGHPNIVKLHDVYYDEVSDLILNSYFTISSLQMCNSVIVLRK